MTEIEQKEISQLAGLPIDWSKLKNTTVLISGGTGFIGQFLINVIKYRNEVFNDNIHVISLSRHAKPSEKYVKYIGADITGNIEIDGSVDFILHLASNTHPSQYAADPVGTITTNVIGCCNLLELAKNKKSEFLLASSVEIYGEGNGKEMDETFCGYIDCNTARAGYNEAKRVSESLCQSYRSQYGMVCKVARLARCFGADRKKDSKAIAQFIGNALKGENIVLKSKGEQRFSYCYVADAVSGILKILLDGEDGQAYNVAADDEGKTLGDYAKLIASYANTKAVFDLSGDNKGVSKSTYAIINCDKLKALGWKPLFPVSEALKRTIDILKIYENIR